jgi:hypothetical protein
MIEQTTLEAHPEKFQKVLRETFNDDLVDMHAYFERLGPYLFSKANGLLVNNSGEETAIKFMTMYNALHPGTY